MHPDTVPDPHRKPPATTLAGLTAAAIVTAVIPALAGLAFLISLATRRPLIGVATRRWPWLTSYPPGDLPRRVQVGLTAAWGIGLLAAGAAQAAGAITGGLTITSPGSFTTRALIALAAEAALTVITIIWLHRKPAPRTLSTVIRAAPKRRSTDQGADCRSGPACAVRESVTCRVRPASTASAWTATQSSAAGSSLAWKHHAAAHGYSSTCTRSHYSDIGIDRPMPSTGLCRRSRGAASRPCWSEATATSRSARSVLTPTAAWRG